MLTLMKYNIQNTRQDDALVSVFYVNNKCLTVFKSI